MSSSHSHSPEDNGNKGLGNHTEELNTENHEVDDTDTAYRKDAEDAYDREVEGSK